MLTLAPAIACALAAPLHAELNIQALEQRAKVAVEDAPPLVLAFYYPWYGLPSGPGGNGRNLHWGEIDPEKSAIELSTHYPTLGPYDSHDPDLIAQHCRWAQEAGLDGFIVSWWGQGDYTDAAMPLILKQAAEHGLKVSLYYESVANGKTAASAAQEIQAVLKEYADHPAWLEVNGHPILFVYGRAVNQLGVAGWLEVQERLRSMDTARPYLIGDEISPLAALAFDGIHTYNPVAQLQGKSPAAIKDWADQLYPQWVDTAREAERISTITVIPGYDDTKIRTPGIRLERHEGELYQTLWQEATEASPDWVLITSFNEWHEGSEIEPSQEHGRKYLEATQELADRFKASKPKGSPNAPSPTITQEEYQQLRRQWQQDNRSLTLLPGADSAAVAWLVNRLELRPSTLSWKELVVNQPTAGQLPFLLYAGDEHYRQTVHKPDDVDKALRRYLKSGGTLVVLPNSV